MSSRRLPVLNIHMFNIESFCGEVWSQIEIGPTGDYKICCLANFNNDYGMAHDKDGKVMNVLTHSIEEAINSETHKEHRRQLRDNIKVKRCRNCYDSEESTKGLDGWGNEHSKKYGRSKRQRVLAGTTQQIPEYVSWATADQYTSEDGTTTSKVVNLDLRFGNLCNQKCIMCNPEFSSLWYDDHAALFGEDKPIKIGDNKTYKLEKDSRGKYELNYTKWWESPIWWERLDSIAPSLRHIYFTGGEPLLVPAMQEIMDKLIAGGYAKDIILRFDTNLSAINKKVIDKFKHFKKIHLCVSVDDVEERYELIRYPGNYNNLLSNIQKLIDNNIEIHYISCCIGVASIYSMVRVIDLAERLGVTAEFRFLEGPWHLDIRSLPKSAKQEIIDFYKNLPGDANRQKWYTAITRLLTKYMETERIDRLTKFVSIMDKLDKLRGTDWRTTLPDVCDILRRHCPETGA